MPLLSLFLSETEMRWLIYLIISKYSFIFYNKIKVTKVSDFQGIGYVKVRVHNYRIQLIVMSYTIYKCEKKCKQ